MSDEIMHIQCSGPFGKATVSFRLPTLEEIEQWKGRWISLTETIYDALKTNATGEPTNPLELRRFKGQAIQVFVDQLSMRQTRDARHRSNSSEEL